MISCFMITLVTEDDHPINDSPSLAESSYGRGSPAVQQDDSPAHDVAAAEDTRYAATRKRRLLLMDDDSSDDEPTD